MYILQFACEINHFLKFHSLAVTCKYIHMYMTVSAKYMLVVVFFN